MGRSFAGRDGCGASPGHPARARQRCFTRRGQAAAPPWCRNVAALRLLATSVRAQARSMNPVRFGASAAHRPSPPPRSGCPPWAASMSVEAELCLGLLHRQPSDGNAGVLEIAAEACAPPGAMTGRSGLAPRYPGPSGLLLQRGLVDRLPRLREYPSQHRLELLDRQPSGPSGRRPGCRTARRTPRCAHSALGHGTCRACRGFSPMWWKKL